MKIAASIFKTLFLCLCIIANTHLAYAQTASILPQGKTQFLDNNGKPLTSGTVDFYIPSTTTRKTTWQNSAETVANSNPVVLDAGGRAIIYGDGSYRQVVKDRLGNVIWDQVTSSTGSGSSSSTSTGDGDLVGTIKPWAGMTAPNQYAFTYGQEVSRTTYATLFTAITSTQATFCTSGSPILSGLSDTTNFWVGMSLENSCTAAGYTTIISKTSTTVTMAANANVTTNVNTVFFPWGNGNHTNTFNLPDLRGFALAGNNNMGGTPNSVLTTTYFGATDPNSTGAAGGTQSVILNSSNVPSVTPAGTNSTSNVSIPNSTQVVILGGGGSSPFSGSAGAAYSVASLNTSVAAAQTFTGSPLPYGGIAVSSTIKTAGSGYTNGSQTLTVSGGTCTTQPQFTITVAGNILTGTPALLTAGSCTVAPANPASLTGAGGSGGTLDVVYSAQAFGKIQPTKTTNYIIKITPDTNSATASGVTSLGSMTGDIACGSGLLCTGNTISSTGTNITVGTTVINSGTTGRPLYDNAGILGEYSSLPVAFGGTNLTSGTSGGILGFTGTTTLASSTLLPFGALIVGGGSGATPSALSLGTATTVLHGNAGGAPTWGAVSLTADVSGTLPIANGGTNASSASGTALDNITGFSGTGFLTRTGAGTYAFQSTTNGITNANLAQAADGTIKSNISGGTANVSDNTITSVFDKLGGTTQGSILYRNSSTWVALTPGTTGQFLTTQGAAANPIWSAGGAGTGTVTSITPSSGLVSSTTTSCSQTAITAAGTLYAASCINAQTGTSYAIADGDRGKLITATNAAAQAYTIAQAGAASNFQSGWFADIKNISTAQVGVVTITPTTSTINGAASYKLPPGQSARITSDGTNYQVIANGGPTTAPSGCAILATATATCSNGSAGANAGTYTPPTNAVWLEIEMIGGGGGGCGSGTTPGAVGAAGDTTFGTLTATKATACSASVGGTGGVPTGSAAYLLKTGGNGGNGSGANLTIGGYGCSSLYGGLGVGGAAGAGAGIAAAANTGSGGGGGGVNTTINGGGGGGCGGFIKAIFSAPLAATYTYAIGAGGTGGTAGTGGAAGGNGGSGYIQIIPHFNY